MISTIKYTMNYLKKILTFTVNKIIFFHWVQSEIILKTLHPFDTDPTETFVLVCWDRNKINFDECIFHTLWRESHKITFIFYQGVVEWTQHKI